MRVLFGGLALLAQASSGIGIPQSISISKSAKSPSQAPASNEPRSWPEGVSAPCKITDELVIEIPLQFVRTAYFFRNGPRPAAVPLKQLTRVENIQFDFFLPHFSGYTLENYENQFDENKVAIYLSAGEPNESEPDAPGSYPPNALKRLLRAHLLDSDGYQDSYGLRCYRGNSIPKKITCYGKRDATGQEYILLDAMVPPYEPGVKSPIMQATYFSKRYGGIEIVWHTNVKNLPHWQAIDSQIWEFLHAWNVVNSEQR